MMSDGGALAPCWEGRALSGLSGVVGCNGGVVVLSPRAEHSYRPDGFEVLEALRCWGGAPMAHTLVRRCEERRKLMRATMSSCVHAYAVRLSQLLPARLDVIRNQFRASSRVVFAGWRLAG